MAYIPMPVYPTGKHPTADYPNGDYPLEGYLTTGYPIGGYLTGLSYISPISFELFQRHCGREADTRP